MYNDNDNAKHNDWTNYETWRVQSDMLQGHIPADFTAIADMGETCVSVRHLAGVLQDFCVERMELDADGLALNYALAFFDRVNWYELAEHMIEFAESPRFLLGTTTR
jgi:hypothetical protein